VSRTAEHLPAPVAGRLRRVKARLDAARFDSRVVRHSYAGRELEVRIVSRYGDRYDRDWPELGEIAFLKTARLGPGARVFNLGANHGVIAMMLAGEVGPTGRVIAVEAHEADIRAAEESARLNGLDQMDCIHAVVARSEGVAAFGVNGEVDDGTGRFGRERVEAVSIDGLARRYGTPDVVFMDIEGYEGEALAGADATLESRPDWFVEVHGDEAIARYGGSAEGIVERFRALGYECHWATDMLGIGPDQRLESRTSFAPLEGPAPAGRFFLAALARPTPAPRS
jgi:FkbM family methyltransferase